MLTTTEGAREKCEDIIWSVHLDILRLPLHTLSLGTPRRRYGGSLVSRQQFVCDLAVSEVVVIRTPSTSSQGGWPLPPSLLALVGEWVIDMRRGQ